jgi:hypothetical protein
MRRIGVLAGIAALIAVSAPFAGAGKKQPAPGTYEFVFKGTTSQGLAIRITARSGFYRQGTALLPGSVSARATTSARFDCPESGGIAATTPTFGLRGLALTYSSAPEAFEITGDLGSLGGSDEASRPAANITARGKLRNYFPTAKSVASGSFSASAVRARPAGPPDQCLSGTVTFKAKFASKRRVGR